MDDPRIRAALERGWVTPQALAHVRGSVPPHELWSALCARIPQLESLAQQATGAQGISPVAPTIAQASPPADASDVAPTLLQDPRRSGRLAQPHPSGRLAQPHPSGRVTQALGLRQQAVHAYQQARSEDPRFMPHADLVLHPIAELGRGGMGVVHRVRDDRLGREAALKLLSEELADTSAVARFMREAELTACLDHPAIPPIYEAGTLASGQPFLLMKVIEGQPFSAVLREAGDRPVGRRQRELLEVVVKVAEAVAYAHGQGILHRDLKPANVMVGEFGEVMVVDWGLARRFDEHDPKREGPSNVQEGLTQAGAVLGTPGYLPPEQADGERVDQRSDVFALGAILTEVLTGKPPVAGSSIPSRLAATLQGRIESPRDRRRDVAPALDAIARCALAAERDQRTATAAEFVADLRAFLADAPVSVYPEGPIGRARRWARRHPALVAVAGVTVAGSLVFGGVSAALLAKADSEARLRKDAEDSAQKAHDASEEAERAQQKAEITAKALTEAKDRLSKLLAVERLPEGDSAFQALRQLEVRLQTEPDELMLRQLARVYLMRGHWERAAEVSLRTATLASLEKDPPFTEVFQAYYLRTTRTGYDEFVRDQGGRKPYFGDLRTRELEDLALRGFDESSGFPQFVRGLRAVADERDQDLDAASDYFAAAAERLATRDAGTRGAVSILQAHVAYHRAKRDASPAGFAQAVAFTEQTLETGFHLALAHVLRAMSLLETADRDPRNGSLAAEACEAAIAQDPTLGLAYGILRNVHRGVGAPALMLEADHTAALRFRPDDAQLHHWRGQIRLQLAQQNAPPWGKHGWGQRAEDDFRAAIKRWDSAAISNGLNVGQLNSRVTLCESLLAQGKGPAAFKALERCMELAETAGDSAAESDAVLNALTRYLSLLLQAQQLDRAAPLLERMARRFPREPSTFYYTAMFHLLQGNRAKAEAAAARLEQLAPGTPMAQDLRKQLKQR